MDPGHFVTAAIKIKFCTFICSDREKMNRDINSWRIKPISDSMRLEQARMMINNKAQREIELWYNENLWRTGQVS